MSQTKLQLEPDNSATFKFREWFKKYWGNHSTGIRNWLLVFVILAFCLLLSFASIAALPAVAFWVVLGIMLLTLSISFGGFLSTLIGTVITDYSKHKKEGSQDFYLSTLLTRSKNWVLEHKFHVFLVSLPFIPLIAFGIPSLLVTPVSGILGMIFFCFFGSVLIDGVLRLQYYLNELTIKDRLKQLDDFLPKIYNSKNGDVISDSKNSTTVNSFMNNQTMRSLLSQKQIPFQELIDELNFDQSILELNGDKRDGALSINCSTDKWSFKIKQEPHSFLFSYFDYSIQETTPILIIERHYYDNNYSDKITLIETMKTNLLPEKIRNYALKLQKPAPLATTGDYADPFTPLPSTVTVEELDDELNTTANKKNK